MAAGDPLRRDSDDPRDLLDMADRLLRRGDPATAGLWPRASAILALQALEAGVRGVWQQRSLALDGCPIAAQLLCLRSYLDDVDLAARTSHAWSALHRACHHHAYELGPTSGELRGWFSVVSELIERTGQGRSSRSRP